MSYTVLKCLGCGEEVVLRSSIGFCSCGCVIMLVDSPVPHKVVKVR